MIRTRYAFCAMKDIICIFQNAILLPTLYKIANFTWLMVYVMFVMQVIIRICMERAALILNICYKIFLDVKGVR